MRGARFFTSVVAVLLIVVGVSVILVGWLLDVEVFRNLAPGQASMKANTASAIALSGIAMLLLRDEGVGDARRKVGYAIALLILAIGVLTLLEYIFDLNVGIDELIVSGEKGAVGTVSPGRMSPQAATSFTCTGLAFLAIDQRFGRFRITSICALLISLIAWFALIGYVAGISDFQGIGTVTKMALTTSIALLLLSSALLAMRPDRGFAKLFFAKGAGADILRRFLPGAIVTPAVLGLLRLKGQDAGLYGTRDGTWLFIVAIVLIFVVAVYLFSRSIQRADEASERASTYKAAQLSVTAVLAEADRIDQVIDRVPSTLAMGLDWELACFWNVDRTSGQLVCNSVWCQPEADFDEFRATTLASKFSPGEGLPGRAWKGQQPVWVEGVVSDNNFPRAPFARDAGIATAVALPVSGGTKTLGVIEFFTRDRREYDEELVATLATTCNQIGQFIGRKRAEQEAEELKEEFFALVSHELRTPLTSITGYLELVTEGDAGEVSDEAKQMLGVVERNAQRLLRLVGDLLFVTQVQKGAFGVELEDDVPLGEIVESCVTAAGPSADLKQINLVGDIKPLVLARGDGDRIAQLVDNLVSNAIKFTPEGGVIEVAATAEGDSATIRVSDSGIGIREEEQEQLFDRFFRASGATENVIAGVGLGLSIVKAVAEAHGGSVIVESRPGQGATFVVSLPNATLRSMPDTNKELRR